MANKFWEEKTLEEMTVAEWESLCDGCGKCCLEKLEEDGTKKIYHTNVACRLLNTETGRCSDYANRQTLVHDCIKLTPSKVKEIKWLPNTCAYRLVSEKKPLFDWHHLVCGDMNRIHEVGMSVKGRALPRALAKDDLTKHIIDWIKS